MSPPTEVLAHFANLKLCGDRLVRELVTPPPHPPARARRRRPSARVSALSDADLEAELAARRLSRARERERFASAMRSEKLAVLEGELSRLRSEISRLDRVVAPPPTRRRSAPRDPLRPQPARPLGKPPKPGPPPPPLPRERKEGETTRNQERVAREKEERVRRREAKRREREMKKKRVTLADIIRGAGPDPIRLLKPPGSIVVPEVGEGVGAAKDEGRGVAGPVAEKAGVGDADVAVNRSGNGNEGTEALASRDTARDRQDKSDGHGSPKGEAEDAKEAKSDSDSEKQTRVAQQAVNIAGGKTSKDEQGNEAIDSAPSSHEHGHMPVDGKTVPETLEKGLSADPQANSQNVASRPLTEKRRASDVLNNHEKDPGKPKMTTIHSDTAIPTARPSPSRPKEGSQLDMSSLGKQPQVSMMLHSSTTTTKPRLSPTAAGDNIDQSKPKYVPTTEAEAPNNEIATGAGGSTVERPASDAIAALSALASNLQAKNGAPPSPKKSSSRMSLAERRRLRRQSNSRRHTKVDPSEADAQAVEQRKQDLADVLAAANALKLE